MIYLKQTKERFFDLHEAKDAVLRMAKKTDARIKADLRLDAGIYRLEKSVDFSVNLEPALSRVELSISCDGGVATITSQKRLHPSDFVKDGEDFVYRFEKDASGDYPKFRDFYMDGKRLPIASSAQFIHAFTFDEEADEGVTPRGIYIPEEAAALLPDDALFPLEFTIYVEWEFFVLHALSVDRNRTKTDGDGNTHVFLEVAEDELDAYINGMTKCLRPKGRPFYFANHSCLMTEGTWCYDCKKGILRYRPKNGVLKECSVPILGHLLSFEGMSGVKLKDLSFTGVTDRYLCENGYMSHQANMEKRLGKKLKEAAIFACDVRRFSVADCHFYEIGVNGILAEGKLSGVHVCDCTFENIGMSAVSIGEPIIPSPKHRDGAFDVRIENNYMTRIAYTFPTAPAIDIFRADGLSICHNTIEYCAYTGISVGWGWGLLDCALGEMTNIRDAEIAYNRIIHHMQTLRDGGAIYAVGSNCERSYTKYFNFMHDNYAYRDEVKQTVRGFYMDGSASNWYAYNNVSSGAQRNAFAQWHVPTEFTWNVRIDETYVTEEVSPGNHAPYRNTLIGNVYLEPTVEALFEKYPKAKEIYENAGCKRKGKA